MPVTKVISSKRTVVSYSIDEIKAALKLDQVLAIYILDGEVEVVISSE